MSTQPSTCPSIHSNFASEANFDILNKRTHSTQLCWYIHSFRCQAYQWRNKNQTNNMTIARSIVTKKKNSCPPHWRYLSISHAQKIILRINSAISRECLQLYHEKYLKIELLSYLQYWKIFQKLIWIERADFEASTFRTHWSWIYATRNGE